MPDVDRHQNLLTKGVRHAMWINASCGEVGGARGDDRRERRRCDVGTGNAKVTIEPVSTSLWATRSTFGFSPLLTDPWIPEQFVGYPETHRASNRLARHEPRLSRPDRTSAGLVDGRRQRLLRCQSPGERRRLLAAARRLLRDAARCCSDGRPLGDAAVIDLGPRWWQRGRDLRAERSSRPATVHERLHAASRRKSPQSRDRTPWCRLPRADRPRQLLLGARARGTPSPSQWDDCTHRSRRERRVRRRQRPIRCVRPRPRR